MKDDFYRALEREAQVINYRVPEDITDEKVAEIRSQLSQFMSERDISQARLASSIGVSSTMISQFLRDKYGGDIESLIGKVVGFMESTVRRESQRKPKYVETSVARKIFSVIRHTDAMSGGHEAKISLIIGDAGHGKSECLREYARTHSSCVYIVLDSTMNKIAIFNEVAKSIGAVLSVLKTTTANIIEKLNSEPKILVLDEASSLTVKQLDHLRQVITVRGRCPLILSGNKQLSGTIQQNSVKHGNESLDQFMSRVLVQLDLDTLANDDGSGLYTEDDIRQLYTYGGVKLTGDAVDLLRRISRTPHSGRLRTCRTIIDALHLSPVIQKGCFIDSIVILLALEQLELPVRSRLPVGLIEEFREKEKLKAAFAG